MLTEMPLRGVRDRVLLLRSLPSFAGLDDAGLTLLAEHARTRSFRAGETVIAEGRPLSHVYIVVSGQITSNRLGKRVAVVTRSRGVGLLSVLARDSNGVDAVADVDTLTLEVPADALQDALEENFSMLRNSLRLSAAALVAKRGNLPASPDRPGPQTLGEYRERPRTMVELMLLLGKTGVFSGVNIDALVAVARTTREVRIAEGEVLWRIGEPSTFWMRVDYGRVRCTAADGRHVDVGPDFILGNLDCFGQAPRSYEARTDTRIIGYRTELDGFLAILETHFQMARDLIAIISKALLETPDRP